MLPDFGSTVSPPARRWLRPIFLAAVRLRPTLRQATGSPAPRRSPAWTIGALFVPCRAAPTALFKNLTLFRLGPDRAVSLAQLQDALDRARFVPCSATQPVAMGWVPPRGPDHAPLVEQVAGHWLLRLMIEKKVLPSAVVKRRAEEMAAQIEAQTGRKPGRRQAKELKEDALHELLPLAFTQRATLGVWIDPEARLLAVDTGSAARADDVVTLLVKTLDDGLPVGYVQTAESPAAAMASWLLHGEPPAQFSVDRECELKAADESKAAVRYARHALDIDEVRQHVASGKLPTRLALTWRSRVSFVLADTLQLRRIEFVDGVLDAAGSRPDDGDDAFDADAALFTGELGRLLPDLIDALGGEQPGIGGEAAAPSAIAADAAPAAIAPWEDEQPA